MDRQAQSRTGVEIIQGKTTIAKASRTFDLTPSEVEEWVDEAKRGMENTLRAKPMEIREQYEKQIKDLQEAYGEAMLEPRARKLSCPCWARTTSRRVRQTGTGRRQHPGIGQQAVSVV